MLCTKTAVLNSKTGVYEMFVRPLSWTGSERGAERIARFCLVFRVSCYTGIKLKELRWQIDWDELGLFSPGGLQNDVMMVVVMEHNRVPPA